MFKKYIKLFLLFILLGLTLAFSNKQSIIFVLIITAIYFLSTLLYRLCNKNKTAITIPETSYPFLKYISIITSICLFIIILFINKSSPLLINNLVEAITYLLLSLLLTYPIKPFIFSNNKDIYNTSCTKTIITEEIPSLDELKRLKESGINIIVFSKKEIPKNLSKYFTEVSVSELDTKLKKKNLFIKKYTKKDIDKLNSYTSTLYVEDELSSIIDYIGDCRGTVDNLIRTIKLNDIISYSVVLLFIITSLFGFPYVFNKYLLLTIVLLLHFLNTYIFPYLEKDYDVLRRQPRELRSPIYTVQEFFFNILEIIAIVICSSVIYMSTLSAGSTVKLSSSITLNTFIYSSIFIIIINLSESLTIVNLLKIFRNIFSLLSIIILILFGVIVWYLPLVDTRFIGFTNFRSSIIMALICTIWFDITKIARYLKIRKRVKHAQTN